MFLPNRAVKIKKTGEAFADRDKIQLLGEFELPNGDKKK